MKDQVGIEPKVRRTEVGKGKMTGSDRSVFQSASRIVPNRREGSAPGTVSGRLGHRRLGRSCVKSGFADLRPSGGAFACRPDRFYGGSYAAEAMLAAPALETVHCSGGGEALDELERKERK